MKTKSLLLLVVAGGCGLVAAIAVAQHMAGNQLIVPTAPQEEQKAVVLATVDLEAGASLKAENLRVAQLPAKDLPEGTFKAVAEVTGQSLRYPVFKGEPVLSAKLGKGLQYLANDLPPGMKACTVRIQDEQDRMKGLINPGNHVDVYWLPMRPELNSASVKLLLQDVKVIAVGERIEGDDSETLDPRNTKSSSLENYTLLVTGIQNKRVVAASSKGGKFRLVLRGKDDKSLEELDERTLDIEIGLTQPPIEEPMTTTPIVDTTPQGEKYEVEIIRGSEQTTQQVDVSEGRRPSAKK